MAIAMTAMVRGRASANLTIHIQRFLDESDRNGAGMFIKIVQVY